MSELLGEAESPAEAEEERRGFFSRLRDSLGKRRKALVGQIAAVETQRRDAALQLQAQQILNENQAAKERQDLLEKQIAEEGQTFAAVGAWQESLKITPTSYTQP